MSQINWFDESIQVVNGVKNPYYNTVTLFTGHGTFNTCVTHIVPNKSIHEQQHTFVAKCTEEILVNDELTIMVDIEDDRGVRLMDSLITEIKKSSKYICRIFAYEEEVDDHEYNRGMYRTLVNDVRCVVPNILELCITYDYTNETAEISIVNTEFRIKKKFEKHLIENRKLIFSIYSNCRKPITLVINN